MKGLSGTASIAPPACTYRAYQPHPDRNNRWVMTLGSAQTDSPFTYCVEVVEVGGETDPNPYATELLLVMKGEGYAQFMSKTMLLKTGDVVLFSPAETCFIKNVGMGRLYLLRIMPHEAFTQRIDQAALVDVDEEDLVVLHQSSLAISHHFPFVASIAAL